MLLHNWVFGHAIVWFSANAAHPDLLIMPPSAYGAALRELANLDLGGEHVKLWVTNVLWWLTGSSGFPWSFYVVRFVVLIPLHAAAIAIVIYVVGWARSLDPWLRLIGASALAQHVVALFYNAAIARYHFLSWLLTMLVVAVWIQRVGIDYLKRRFPALSAQFAVHPWSQRLASGLAWLQKASA